MRYGGLEDPDFQSSFYSKSRLYSYLYLQAANNSQIAFKANWKLAASFYSDFHDFFHKCMIMLTK